MTNAQFFSSGLKFSCKRCSACCRYDAGFVYLSEKDIEKLALNLKMDKNAFINTYCRWVAYWHGDKGQDALSLKEKPNNDCIFWDSGCTVYQSRPLQCVTFPFWSSIVSSKKSWEIAAAACPGMNSGALHTGDEIGVYLNMRTKEPLIQRKGAVE